MCVEVEIEGGTAYSGGVDAARDALSHTALACFVNMEPTRALPESAGRRRGPPAGGEEEEEEASPKPALPRARTPAHIATQRGLYTAARVVVSSAGRLIVSK